MRATRSRQNLKYAELWKFTRDRGHVPPPADANNCQKRRHLAGVVAGVAALGNYNRRRGAACRLDNSTRGNYSNGRERTFSYPGVITI